MFFWTGILFGLTGSLHCVGMCGPIALAIPIGGAAPAKKIFLILLYNLGRASTYALLGIVAGLTGAGIVLAGYQQLLSIVVGLLLFLSAFFPLFSKSSMLAPIFRGLRNTMSALFRRKEKKDLFVIGLLNGLLPCGLVYLALAVALATGNVADGSMFMFMFGLGTFPLMSIMPYAGSFIGEGLRFKFRRSVPVMAALMGIVLLLRGLNLGIPYLSPRFDNKGGMSCHEVSATNNTPKPIICTGHVSRATR